MGSRKPHGGSVYEGQRAPLAALVGARRRLLVLVLATPLALSVQGCGAFRPATELEAPPSASPGAFEEETVMAGVEPDDASVSPASAAPDARPCDSTSPIPCIEQLSGSERLSALQRLHEAWDIAILSTSPLLPRRVPTIERLRSAERRNVPVGVLRLRVLNTDEEAALLVFDEEGRLRARALQRFNRIAYDQRSQVAIAMSPRLLRILYELGQHFDSTVEVVSAHRLRGVNASEGSRHASGEACDVRIPNVDVREIVRWFDGTFRDVGVGNYPVSDFAHIDVRDHDYYWTDRSGPGQRSRLREREPWTEKIEHDATLGSLHLDEWQLFRPCVSVWCSEDDEITRSEDPGPASYRSDELP